MISKFAVVKLAAAAALLTGALSGAQATPVTSFDAAFVANGQWFNTDTRPGGTATIETLSGAAAVGAPLPTGAAKLTTNGSGSSKAEVGVNDRYGQAGNILRSLDLQFFYYKVAGGDAAPAPSLKLTFSNPQTSGSGANRGFITLVWEAYVQPFPSFSNPATDVWTGVDIDFTHGVFWGTNGFGNTNSGGGSPYRTLSNWLSVLNTDFGAADLNNVAIGVGTNNLNQLSYFDDVKITHSFGGGYNASYDFEAATTSVPEPATLALIGIALAGLGISRRKKA